MAYGNVDVTSSATLIVAPNKRRTSLKIRNNGDDKLYWAFDASVTVDNGFPLKVDEMVLEVVQTDKQTLIETMYTGPIYGIAGTTQDVRFVETDDISDVRQV